MVKNDGYRPAPVLEEASKPPAKRVKKQGKKTKGTKAPEQQQMDDESSEDSSFLPQTFMCYNL
jgi:hypothetical protein